MSSPQLTTNMMTQELPTATHDGIVHGDGEPLLAHDSSKALSSALSQQYLAANQAEKQTTSSVHN